jgi:hypothetical protein
VIGWWLVVVGCWLVVLKREWVAKADGNEFSPESISDNSSLPLAKANGNEEFKNGFSLNSSIWSIYYGEFAASHISA